MSLIHRERGGVAVYEYAQDENQIQRALKAIDDRLVLWPPDGMCAYYRVARNVSDWQDAEIIASWKDQNGNPLPLSSGLIDEVDRLRRDARNKGLDVDAYNAKRTEDLEAERATRGQQIIDEHRPKVERARTSVSFGPLTRLGEQPTRIKKPRNR